MMIWLFIVVGNADAPPIPMADAPLKTLLFLGSGRKAAPFFGRLPPRTGDRVVNFTKASVAAMNAAAGGKPTLEVEVIDILNFPSLLSLSTLDGNPSYYAAPKPDSLPEDIASLVAKVESADCYLIVTPECTRNPSLPAPRCSHASCLLPSAHRSSRALAFADNHTIPPVLTQLMNMTGCSKYANKVSGTVCYSGFPSPAGGARCAVALRPFLSELGCLPVSKQVIIPNANAQLTDEGVPQGDHAEGCQKQMDGMLEQLRWWAEATRAQRAK
jgi:chromate reductase